MIRHNTFSNIRTRARTPMMLREAENKSSTGERFLHLNNLIPHSKPQGKFIPHHRIKRKTSGSERVCQKISLFKRKLLRESGRVKVTENPNFFIQQLVTVPIAERKKSEGRFRRGSGFLSTGKFEKAEKVSRRKCVENKNVIMDLGSNKPMVLYCDPLTIEDTESPSPPFKPRYL